MKIENIFRNRFQPQFQEQENQNLKIREIIPHQFIIERLKSSKRYHTRTFYKICPFFLNFGFQIPTLFTHLNYSPITHIFLFIISLSPKKAKTPPLSPSLPLSSLEQRLNSWGDKEIRENPSNTHTQNPQLPPKPLLKIQFSREHSF